ARAPHLGRRRPDPAAGRRHPRHRSFAALSIRWRSPARGRWLLVNVNRITHRTPGRKHSCQRDPYVTGIFRFSCDIPCDGSLVWVMDATTTQRRACWVAAALAMLGGCVANESPVAEETFQPIGAGGPCPDAMCGENSPVNDALGFHEQSLL